MAGHMAGSRFGLPKPFGREANGMEKPEMSKETEQVPIAGGILEVEKAALGNVMQPQDSLPVTLDEAKLYLRVDSAEDDEIITACLSKAWTLCKAVSRLDDEEFSAEGNAASVKAAVLYALGFLYQNRECADHRELALTLRALLMDVRREVF